MPWHPPIPAEAVYRDEVADLGAGLRLLLYCYNCVERDGTLVLSLTQASVTLKVQYETLRKWWQALRSTTIVTVIGDHGKRGIELRINSAWLDWHVLAQNYPASTSGERSNITVEETMNGQILPLKAAERPVNGFSTSGERSNITVEHSAYKVLMTSDQAEREEDQDGTAHSLSHPAIAAYKQAFPQVRLNRKQEAIITALVGEGVERLECWREVIQDYELSTHWKPENIGNMRSRFETKLIERSTRKSTNGQRPAEVRPPLPVVTYKPPTDALSPAEIAQRLKEHRR